KRRFLGPTQVSIADPHNHVLNRLCFESGNRGPRKFGQDLNAVDLVHESCKNCRLIPRSCSNLQNPMLFARVQQLGHECNDEGLRDRLPVANGERRVIKCMKTNAFRHEQLARNRSHGSEYVRVFHPTSLDLIFHHSKSATGWTLAMQKCWYQHRTTY